MNLASLATRKKTGADWISIAIATEKKHNRHNDRDKGGCNASWAYLGMLAKIKLLSGHEEGRLAGAGREIA